MQDTQPSLPVAPERNVTVIGHDEFHDLVRSAAAEVLGRTDGLPRGARRSLPARIAERTAREAIRAGYTKRKATP